MKDLSKHRLQFGLRALFFVVFISGVIAAMGTENPRYYLLFIALAAIVLDHFMAPWWAERKEKSRIARIVDESFTRCLGGLAGAFAGAIVGACFTCS